MCRRERHTTCCGHPTPREAATPATSAARGQEAALYKESLALNRDMASKGLIQRVLYNLGYVAQHQGDEERAARLFGAVAALIDASSNFLEPDERAEAERHVASVHTALGEEAFAAAWAAGRAMPLEEAMCVALEEVADG